MLNCYNQKLCSKNLKSIQRLVKIQLNLWLLSSCDVCKNAITVACHLPFGIVFSDGSRLNLYSQHHCRRAVRCNHHHFHHRHPRALLVFFLLSQVQLRAVFAISFDDFETKPVWGIKEKKCWKLIIKIIC